MSRRRVQKTQTAQTQSRKPAAKQHLRDMPLARMRAVKSFLVFTSAATYLQLNNLEEPLVWGLGLARTQKADPAVQAAGFGVLGSRHLHPLQEPSSVPAVLVSKDAPPLDSGHAVEGITEFGLQADDDHEYFLSKFGDLVGVMRVTRKEGGEWKASMAKSNVPRVLSAEAVASGLMPPLGQSALPKSLEAVVPTELQFWKAQDLDEARGLRDMLVDSAFFTDDCVKAVDGELRKVEVKYFVFEPGQDMAPAKGGGAPSFGQAVLDAVPEEALDTITTPMSDGGDWLEKLDAADGPEAFALLSPPAGVATPREMARAAATLKGGFLMHHDDTREAHRAFNEVGVVFKLRGHAGQLFCASYVPTSKGVSWMAKAEDGTVVKTVDFHDIKISIDRPAGYVQKGTAPDGTEWERVYAVDYGFIPNTTGGDGASLDVYVGPSLSSDRVFWVTQRKIDGSFDEYKLLVGFDTARDARETYLKHVPARMLGETYELTPGILKSLLGLDPGEVAKRLAKRAAVRKDISIDKMQAAVGNALREKLAPSEDSYGPDSPWVQELFEDSVVYCYQTKTWRDGYTYDPATDVASVAGAPLEVTRTWTPVNGGGQVEQPATAPAEQTPESDADAATQVADEAKAMSKRTLKVAKAEELGDERYVLGIVLEPDVIDSQNDTYNEAAVRASAEKFMESYRNVGLMHQEIINDKVRILESYLAPVDMDLGGMTVKKGTWLMAVRVNDDGLWDAVKKGKLTGFSIGGSALRTPVSEV